MKEEVGQSFKRSWYKCFVN